MILWTKLKSHLSKRGLRGRVNLLIELIVARLDRQSSID